MKRFLSLMLTAALLLALGACGAGNAPADPTAKPTAQSKPGPTAQSSAQPKPDPVQPASAAAETLARAVYPEMAPYPEEGGKDTEAQWLAWRDGLNAQRSQLGEYAQGLEPWLTACLTEYLGSGEGNRIIAPMNLYMALAMLAEVTAGNSRAQLLNLLGEESIEGLRARAKALWNASYRDDGLVTRRLAASLWLNDRLSFAQDTVDLLAENYYASSFRGKMGSAQFDKALRSWLNEQTGDLLKDQASGLHMDPDTVLALATTIYFKAAWQNKFNQGATQPMTFHGKSGDRETDFLRKSSTGEYYWGEGFSAVAVPLKDGAMWFILPDEGKTPADLFHGEALAFLLDRSDWEKCKTLTVHFSAPRFDLSSDLDLIGGLEDLGVTDVFTPYIADFTPLTTDTEVYVSQVKHAARVMIDEEGCTGAAYTVIIAPAAGACMPPEEEVEFTVDRPFLFLVTDSNGLPQFAGVVNDAK